MIALRGDLPMLAKNPLTSGNPNGDYLYGIGDADAQAVFVYNFDKRWAAGFGIRVIAPTAATFSAVENGRSCRLPASAMDCPKSVPAATLSPSHGTM